MNVKNCRSCGRIFNYFSGPQICQVCREGLEAKFQTVKAYIQEHPGAGIREVSDACEVDPSLINQWLREERLELAEGSTMLLGCESCGAPIRSGRFCDACRYNMTMSFRGAMRSNAPKAPEPQKRDKDNPKMRYLQ